MSESKSFFLQSKAVFANQKLFGLAAIFEHRRRFYSPKRGKSALLWRTERSPRFACGGHHVASAARSHTGSLSVDRLAFDSVERSFETDDHPNSQNLNDPNTS